MDLAQQILNLPCPVVVDSVSPGTRNSQEGYVTSYCNASHAAAELAAKAGAERAEHSCQWSQDEDGNWDTACGGKFIFMEDGPKENKFRFCPYCGGKLVEHAANPSEASTVARI